LNYDNPTTAKCQWINPSKHLVEGVMVRWNSSSFIADNTSIITVMLDPPGPPRSQILKRQVRVGAHVASTPRLKLSNEEKDVGVDHLFNSRDNVVTVTNSIISLPQPVNIENLNEEKNFKRVMYDRNRGEISGISLSVPSKVISNSSQPHEHFKALCKKTVHELCMNPRSRSTI